MVNNNHKKLTVLHLASWYPKPFNPLLGIFIKKHLIILESAINQAVIYINSLNNVPGGFTVNFRRNEIFEIEIALEKNSNLKPLYLLIGVFKAYKIFNQKIGKPNLIHLHAILPLAPMAILLYWATRKPLVFTEHWTGYQPEDGNYNGFLKKLFTKYLIKKSAAGITVSKHLAKTMQKAGLPFNETVISNAVDLEIFNQSKKQIVKGRFVHVSSFDERQKNILGILRAFSEAYKHNNNLTLFLVGPMENAIEAQNFIQEQQLKEVIHFCGIRTDHELATLIKNSEALILFSNFENQPVVILEALSCGTPVITTHVGGIMEIINSENGILVEPKNETQLTQAILNIASKKITFNSQSISDQIFKIVNPQTIKQLHLEIYNRVTLNA